MWWVDVIIVLLLSAAGWFGWRRGLVFVALDLAGFVLALAVATFTYSWLGSGLASLLSIQPRLGKALAFVMIWVVIDGLYVMATHYFKPHLDKARLRSTINRAGGSVLGVMRSAVLIAMSLILFASLPLAAQQKEWVTKSLIAGRLLSSTGKLQQQLQAWLQPGIQDTFNLITIKPESNESLDLGYTTTDVLVNGEAETEMLELVNAERTKRGLVALSMNKAIQKVARKHSRDMFARGYFAHINPDGLDPFDRLQAGGVSYRHAGENLALAPTVTLAHDGLMNSPGHRANILDPDYRQVGMAAIESTRHGIMFTQNFTD